MHLPLMKWAKMHPICRDSLIHIANERRTSPSHGAMLKAMGVMPSVSDLFLMVTAGGLSGYWIELKAPGKRVTKEQAEFLSRARENGYAADWFDNWEKAKDSIVNYLSGLYTCNVNF